MLKLFKHAAEPLLQESIIASGRCGVDAVYTLDSEGVLIISGSGPTTNYGVKYGRSPFLNDSRVKKVIIESGVETVSACLFQDCNELESVIFADTVRSIDISAFVYCPSIQELKIVGHNPRYSCIRNCLVDKTTGTIILGCANSVIPDDGSAESIGEYAFAGRRGLIHLYVPGAIHTISASSFAGCPDLRVAFLAEGVKDIGAWAFAGNKRLVSLSFPKSAVTIGRGACYMCSSLTDLTIHNGVKTLGLAAFKKCSALSEVALPQSLEILHDHAFSDCKRLRRLFIPAATTISGPNVIKNCSPTLSVIEYAAAAV